MRRENDHMKKNIGSRGRIKQFYSIKTAIQFSFSILIVLALVTFLLVALHFTEKAVLTNSIDDTSRLINQVNYDIDSYIDYMENISYVFSADSDMKKFLFDTKLTDVEKAQQKNRILAQYKTVKEGRKDISNIGVFANDGEYIINNKTVKLNENAHLEEQGWYKDAMSATSGTALSSSHVQNVIKNNYNWVITLSKVLTDPKSNEKKGLFFIDLNYSAISDLCNNNKIGDQGYIFILDKDGNLIYHPQQQLIYGGLKSEVVSEILTCDSNHLIECVDGEEKLFTISKSEKTGWIVVGTAYTSELLKTSNQAKIIYAIVAAIILILALVTANQIVKGITSPVAVLRDSMKKVEEGEFEQVSPKLITNNEIGNLSESFNKMTIKIRALMEQIIKEQEELRKSEMRALQSQINPHFLYNTLDSIIWMAEGQNMEEVVTMTAALAKLLRQTIGNENEVLLLRQEVDYIKSYLTIQKMRYKDKLEYEIIMEPEILKNRIIKLVLQPIVENAIYHGIKYKESLGLLTIRGYQKGRCIYIEVADNGVGMEEETIAHIFEKHKVNYRSNGVGVYNVQRRLQLYYGMDYGLTYESKKGEGTKVTIRIPAEDKEELYET